MIGPDPNFSGGIESVIRALVEIKYHDLRFTNLISWSPKSFFGISHWLKTLSKLYKLRSRNREVVVHVQIGNYGSWIREGSIVRLALLLKFRTVITLHGSSLENASVVFFNFLSCILKFKVLSAIVTLTPATFAKLLTYCSNVQLLPNPIQISKKIEKWKGQESKQVVFVGTIDTRKGVDTLLTAWEEIVKYNSDWSLTLIGPMGNLKLTLEKFSKMENVHWLGACAPSVVTAHLEKCAFVTLPSLHEQSPMIIWEAIHVGTPVLASNLSGIEYQLGVEYPCLVQPGNKESLLKSLNMMMSDKELRISMSVQSKLRSEMISPDRVSIKYLELYHKVFGSEY